MHLTPAATVFDENWNKVEAKAGNKGLLAVSGAIPIGYYKDEEKTAQTMTVVDGLRYSCPGDWVEFQEDGSVIFLGRGNVSINTGGEKVFPEEIEITLRAHPEVADCLIVGVPDDRFGQAITAVIRLDRMQNRMRKCSKRMCAWNLQITKCRSMCCSSLKYSALPQERQTTR